MKKFKQKVAYILLGSIIIGCVQSSIAYANQNEIKGENIVSGIFGAGADFTRQLLKDVVKVEIPDGNLRKALLDKLGKEDGHITISDLESLQNLELDELGIKNLEGMQYCINLTSLTLLGNEITDLGALSNLKKLETLELEGNNISDLEPLRNLVNLDTLNLNGNKINDLTALSGLTKLTVLTLDNNDLSNIDTIKNLVNLEYLHVSYNNLTNVPDVSGLKNLKQLYLTDNEITNIDFILNVDIGDVKLQGNKFSVDDEKIKEITEKLKERGYEVKLKEDQ